MYPIDLLKVCLCLHSADAHEEMLMTGTDADAGRQPIARRDIHWYWECYCDNIESGGGPGAVARSLIRGCGSRCARNAYMRENTHERDKI